MTTPFDHRKARKAKNRRRLPWGLRLHRVRFRLQTKRGAWVWDVTTGFYLRKDRPENGGKA